MNPKESLINYESDHFLEFCAHVNSRLCVVDFLQVANRLANYDPLARPPVFLTCDDEDAGSVLLGGEYADLLLNVGMRLEVTPASMDSFRSELDDTILGFFASLLLAERSKVVVLTDADNNRFRLEAADIFTDLVMPALVQLHMEMLGHARHFARMLGAVEGDAKRLFLNAHGAGTYSQYLMTWVCVLLDIPLMQEGLIAVV